MNLIETKIPNITETTIDVSKVALANQIIRDVYPLFDEVYAGKLANVSELKREYFNKRHEVKGAKKELEEIMESYQKKKKISLLLNRIEKLISAGLTYDGSFKHEIVILLKVVDKLSDGKLDEHLNEMMQILKKRFAR